MRTFCNLDALDIRIVRELTHGSHPGLAWGEISPSYGSLARKLGVSRDTVRKRLEKMSKTNFLRVFPVQVNPTLLGLKMGALSLDVPAGSESGLIDKVSLVENVILIARHVGGMVGLTFYYSDDAAMRKKVQLIKRICGATATRFTEIPFPRCGVRLSPLDWKILAALQRRRSERVGEIARALGISSRTLRRRTKRMIDGMAIGTLVSSDVRALQGGVICNVQVEYSPRADRAETDGLLLRELDPHLIYAGLWTDFSLFTVVLGSVPESSEVLEGVKRLKGIANARLDIIEERAEVYSTLSEQVERRLKGL